LAAAKELSTKTSRPFYASDGWVALSSGGKVVSEKPFYKFANGSQSTESKIFDEVSGASARKLILGFETFTSRLDKILLNPKFDVIFNGSPRNTARQLEHYVSKQNQHNPRLGRRV
jgi:hypothetical protein